MFFVVLPGSWPKNFMHCSSRNGWPRAHFGMWARRQLNVACVLLLDRTSTRQWGGLKKRKRRQRCSPECLASIEIDVITSCLGKIGGLGEEKEFCVVAMVSCALGESNVSAWTWQEGTWFHRPASLSLSFLNFVLCFIHVFIPFSFIQSFSLNFVLFMFSFLFHSFHLCHWSGDYNSVIVFFFFLHHWLFSVSELRLQLVSTLALQNKWS